MTEDTGRQIEITVAMREDFVTTFLMATHDAEDTILKSDLRSAFAHWLSEEHGRYRKDIDNPAAGTLHKEIRDLLGPMEESRNANGHALFVGLVMAIPLGADNHLSSIREMNAHDWTTRKIQELGDGLESRLEVCGCGTWRISFIERDANRVILKNVVHHVEYSKSYKVMKTQYGASCPHTGRIP